jgi:hypothetical protein
MWFPISTALTAWLQLGVGPGYLLRGVRQHVSYRGQPCDVTITVAFSNSGDLQMELIHQENDTPSIYNEFLSSGHEGFHQFAY